MDKPKHIGHDPPTAGEHTTAQRGGQPELPLAKRPKLGRKVKAPAALTLFTGETLLYKGSEFPLYGFFAAVFDHQGYVTYR